MLIDYDIFSPLEIILFVNFCFFFSILFKYENGWIDNELQIKGNLSTNNRNGKVMKTGVIVIKLYDYKGSIEKNRLVGWDV